MWDYKKNLQENKEKNATPVEMARKLYLSFPTAAFVDEHEIEYEIRNRVRRLYDIPLAAVQVIGSAKTGFSLIKNTAFNKNRSDLDLAIIDPRLFARFWEEAYEASKAYEATRFTDVQNRAGEIVEGSGKLRFLDYLQRGIISPEHLPSGHLRAKIIQDFNRITNEYKDHFKKISAFYYSNEFFFQEKLKDTITRHWEKI